MLTDLILLLLILVESDDSVIGGFSTFKSLVSLVSGPALYFMETVSDFTLSALVIIIILSVGYLLF